MSEEIDLSRIGLNASNVLSDDYLHKCIVDICKIGDIKNTSKLEEECYIFELEKVINKYYEKTIEEINISGFDDSVERLGIIMKHKYGGTLKLLKVYLVFVQLYVESLANAINRDDAFKEDKLMFLLFSMYRKSCQIGNEMLHLIEGGFSTGAEARWRTLYEFAVLSKFFISDFVEKSDVERYEKHAILIDEKKVRLAIKYKDSLLFEKNLEQQYEELRNEYDKVINENRYSGFKKTYGWYKKNPKINLIEIAGLVDLEHLHYRLIQVHQLNHASSNYLKGDRADDEAREQFGGSYVRSHLGMEQPMQYIPYTLGIVVDSMVEYISRFDYNINHVVDINVLRLISNQIQKSYFQEESLYRKRMKMKPTKK